MELYIKEVSLSQADYNLDFGTSLVLANVDALIVTAPFGENGAVYDLPGTLDDGDSIEWPFTQYLNIGIVSESVDKTGSDIVTRSVFNTNFDLLFPARTGWINFYIRTHYRCRSYERCRMG